MTKSRPIDGKGIRFGKNLKKFLDLMDMSNTEFANMTGLTQACISQIINGKREPGLSTVIKILNVIPAKFESFLK